VSETTKPREKGPGILMGPALRTANPNYLSTRRYRSGIAFSCKDKKHLIELLAEPLACMFMKKTMSQIN
jgi:hypothetical protein